jgi:molybdopterin-biosynthesis enzyme MoeA-like protein
MKTRLGFYIDVNGIVIEVFPGMPNVELEQMRGFVQVNILETHLNGENEIVESYVLNGAIKSIEELESE